MHLHINHSTYFKYLISFAGASIAIVETANIIDHNLHPHFPLVQSVLLSLLALFLVGLFFTYQNQKAPDRIRNALKINLRNGRLPKVAKRFLDKYL